ncbi:MAG: CPBP family intramembrane glutamic endopeptidase [Desulfitobacteriaceae bacterium]
MRKKFSMRQPAWNMWQVLVLMLLVNLVELSLGWLDTPKNLDALAGRMHFILVGLGEALLYMVAVGFLLWKLKRPFRDLGLVSVRWRYIVLGLFTGVLLFVSIGLLGNLLTHVVGVPPPQSLTEAVKGSKYAWEFGLLLFLVGWIAPLKEEILFRGLLYPTLRQAYGPGKGILVTGIFFAMLHVDFVRFLPLFLGGVVLTWLYERSASVWPSILAHGVWNILMALALWIQR